MGDNLMSQRTAELLLLLSSDGVDQEELVALASSAFEDGIKCRLKLLGDRGDSSPRRAG